MTTALLSYTTSGDTIAETAKMVAPWADGLLTVGGALEDTKRVVDAFRDHGGERKPIVLQSALSWADTDEEALAGAMDQWSSRAVAGEVAWDLRRPADFDETGKLVTEAKMRETLPISSDLAFHAAWIADLLTLGPAELHLHQVGRDQRGFIDAFGARVLPQLGVKL